MQAIGYNGAEMSWHGGTDFERWHQRNSARLVGTIVGSKRNCRMLTAIRSEESTTTQNSYLSANYDTGLGRLPGLVARSNGAHGVSSSRSAGDLDRNGCIPTRGLGASPVVSSADDGGVACHHVPKQKVLRVYPICLGRFSRSRVIALKCDVSHCGQH